MVSAYGEDMRQTQPSKLFLYLMGQHGLAASGQPPEKSIDLVISKLNQPSFQLLPYRLEMRVL
jgi:hypothetical protein